MIPPWLTFGVRSLVFELCRGFVCRLAMLIPSTTTAAVASGDSAAHCRPYFARVFFALLVRQDALDRAALAGVLAGEDDDRVAATDLGHLRDAARAALCRGHRHHSTSGASETIFM